MGLFDWFKVRKSLNRLTQDVIEGYIQKYGKTIGWPIGFYTACSGFLLMPGDLPLQTFVNYQEATSNLREMLTKSGLRHSEEFPEIRKTLIPSLIGDMESLFLVVTYNGLGSSSDCQHAADTNIKTVIEILKDLTEQDFGRDKDKWQKWWDENKHVPFIARSMQPKKTDNMLKYKPFICFKCNSCFNKPGLPFYEIVGDEIHFHIVSGFIGGDIICPQCLEKYDYQPYEGRLSLELTAIPIGYVGSRKKVFDPI